MGKIVTIILALLFATVSMTSAADKVSDKGELTQSAFVAKLVDVFGWSEGLPEKPADKDYLAILSGRRSLRFEAEDVYDKQTDTVTVRNFNLYGAFSSRGWVHGVTVPTAVHFTVFLPLAGKYAISAATKGDGQLWSIAGRAFKVNAATTLKEVTIGQVFIPPGKLEFNAVIPADGGIDYIQFTAPSLAPLEPLRGWNFAAPLTRVELAEFRAALLDNEKLLPDDGSYPLKSVSAAALPSLPPGVQLTASQVHGKPTDKNWLRAGQAPATVAVPFTAEAVGVYKVRVRFTGSNLTAVFGPKAVSLEGKPYLDWLDLGTFRLAKGAHTLQLQLPPSGGIDAVEISRKSSSAADYLALAALAGAPEDRLPLAELDAVMKSLQEGFQERR